MCVYAFYAQNALSLSFEEWRKLSRNQVREQRRRESELAKESLFKAQLPERSEELVSRSVEDWEMQKRIQRQKQRKDEMKRTQMMKEKKQKRQDLSRRLYRQWLRSKRVQEREYVKSRDHEEHVRLQNEKQLKIEKWSKKDIVLSYSYSTTYNAKP